MRPSLLAALVALSLAAPSTSTAQCNQSCPERRAISVNATGTVTADADLAIVRVGYKLFAPEGKAAYASATATSNAIMDALTAQHIPKTAIESTSQVLQHTQPYELQPYSPNTSEWQQRQFTVTQSWTIRVKPDDAAKALSAAVNAGGNESGWIQWIVQDPEPLLAEASAKAAANAQATAARIARESKVQLGKLISISPNSGGGWGGAPIAGVAGSIGLGNGYVTRLQVGNEQLAINSPRVEFNVTVYTVFEIQ